MKERQRQTTKKEIAERKKRQRGSEKKNDTKKEGKKREKNTERKILTIKDKVSTEHQVRY